jgi:hypothetical protein
MAMHLSKSQADVHVKRRFSVGSPTLDADDL